MKHSGFQSITAQILKQLENGNVPWSRPWSVIPPQNINGREYTEINRLLLGLSSYAYPYFMTMNQVNQHSGQVKKGAKAHLAVFWKIVDVKEVDDGIEKIKKIPHLRYYHVFNIEQTTLPLSIAKNTTKLGAMSKPTDEETFVAGTRFLQSLQNVPEIEFNSGKAFYNPKADKIGMPHRDLFKSDSEYFTTIFHELIHSTGHPDRLNRSGIKVVGFGTEEYSKEELIAEIGACFLCSIAGVPMPVKDSAAYIKGWSKALKHDPTLIVQTAGAVENAVNYLLRKKSDVEEDE